MVVRKAVAILAGSAGVRKAAAGVVVAGDSAGVDAAVTFEELALGMEHCFLLRRLRPPEPEREAAALCDKIFDSTAWGQ